MLCPPAVLTGCVASAHRWVRGRSGAGRGRSWRSGRGIKPSLFLYCKVITRAFQSLICREHPGVIGSFPQAWQQFPHHTSPASKPCKLPHLGSHWDTCAAELPARLPPTSSSFWPRNRDEDPGWDPGLQLGASHHQASGVGCSLDHLAQLLARSGSQHCQHTKSMFSPSAASQGVLVEISGPHSTLQHPSSVACHWHRQGLGCVFPDGAQGGSGWQCQVSAGSFPGLSLSCR